MTKGTPRATSTRSRVASVVAALAFAIGVVAVGTGTAGAAEACSLEGYTGAPVLTVTPGTVRPGTEVTITGTGFAPPGCETTIAVGDTVIGKVIVGEDGSFTLNWTVPADWPLGDFDVSASGMDGTVLASTTIDVVSGTTTPPADVPVAHQPSAPSGGGLLPKTGSQILPVAMGGMVLLVVGAGLVVLAMRRRRPATN